jgi:hypothetical protein
MNDSTKAYISTQIVVEETAVHENDPYNDDVPLKKPSNIGKSALLPSKPTLDRSTGGLNIFKRIGQI